MFTQKHFNLLANMLRENNSYEEFTEHLIKVFKEDNPKFKEDMFRHTIKKPTRNEVLSRSEVLYPSYPLGYVTKY